MTTADQLAAEHLAKYPNHNVVVKQVGDAKTFDLAPAMCVFCEECPLFSYCDVIVTDAFLDDNTASLKRLKDRYPGNEPLSSLSSDSYFTCRRQQGQHLPVVPRLRVVMQPSQSQKLVVERSCGFVPRRRHRKILTLCRDLIM